MGTPVFGTPVHGFRRPPVTIALQLQSLISGGLLSAHGTPMNETYQNPITGVWIIHWKWGTWSSWPYTSDPDVLFIRYCTLCLNEDLVMIIPHGLCKPPPEITQSEQDQPWWFVFKFIGEMPIDASKEVSEASNDFLTLMAAKRAAYQLKAEDSLPPIGTPWSGTPTTPLTLPTEPVADMTDAMHCVRFDGTTPWNGNQGELPKATQMTWYVQGSNTSSER
jgi:hypothetical protein